MMRRVFRLPATRARLAREVDDELAFHLETRVRQLVASGLAPDAARREAARQFGDVESVRRSCVTMDEQRELSMRRANYMSEVLQDLAFTLRTLRRNAGFATLVVGALAIGIGANTAIFSMIDAVFVRGLPVSHPEQLVAIGDPDARQLALGRLAAHRSAVGAAVPRRARSQRRVHRRARVRPDGPARRAHRRTRRERVSSIRAGGSCPATTSRCSACSAVRPVGRSTPVRTPSPAATPPLVISHGYWTTAIPRRSLGDRSVDDDRRRAIHDRRRRAASRSRARSSSSGRTCGFRSVCTTRCARTRRCFAIASPSWLLLLGRLKPGATLGQARAEIGPLVMRSIVANASPMVASGFRTESPQDVGVIRREGFLARAQHVRGAARSR